MAHRLRLLGSLLLVVFAAVAVADKESKEIARARTPNVWLFGIGSTYWPDVHDIDPAGSPFSIELGRFHTWGYHLEVAFQRRVARRGRGELLVGGDFGMFGSENSADISATVLPSGGTIDGTLLARGLYLTPSMRWVLPAEGRFRFCVGGGAGYYDVDFTELIGGSLESGELFSESAFGGYLSLGFDYRLGRSRWLLRFENKSHFADFGSTESYSVGSGDLGAPPSTLLIGAVYDR